jgi:hypothetical protein
MATAYQTLTDTERALSEKLQAQSRAADEWECYRHPHATRLAAIADALARNFKLAQQDRSALRLAALAHDLGLVAMQRDYIGHSGPLSLEERLDLARHPIISEQESMRLGAPRAVQLLVRWHHESWNGSGYPDALQREQIPLAARILRVADTYAALTDDRPFRSALTEEEALKVIAEGAGLEFDPAVAQALFTLEDLPELRSYAVRPMAAQTPPPAWNEPQTPALPNELVEPAPDVAAPPAENVGEPFAEPALAVSAPTIFSEPPVMAEETTATSAPEETAPESFSQADTYAPLAPLPEAEAAEETAATPEDTAPPESEPPAAEETAPPVYESVAFDFANAPEQEKAIFQLWEAGQITTAPGKQETPAQTADTADENNQGTASWT